MDKLIALVVPLVVKLLLLTAGSWSALDAEAAKPFLCFSLAAYTGGETACLKAGNRVLRLAHIVH